MKPKATVFVVDDDPAVRDSLALLLGEVMTLAVDGLPNKEIARRLGISHRTVEIDKARIMHKTGADTVLELARIAEASGLRA